MYQSDPELLDEAVDALGIRTHPNAREIIAAALLLAAHAQDEGEISEHRALVLCAQFGFRFDTHDESRLVLYLMLGFLERVHGRDVALTEAPLQSFEAHFYRDRHGQLRARFIMGNSTFEAVALTEEWEVKFVRAYHESLQQALARGHGKPA